MCNRARIRLSLLANACAVSLCFLASCTEVSSVDDPAGEEPASSPSRERNAEANDPYAGVNRVSKDRDGWQELLRANKSIRRTVWHTSNGVEAVTESDDPVVAAKIIEHSKAMQARMKAGAQVRVWDPVFAELFKKHGVVSLDVTTTDKGVRIVESSEEPEAVVLLRSHAMGVSEFVREGFKSSPRETVRFNGADPLPAPELAIGGVAHRFLLAEPDVGQLAALKSAGVNPVLSASELGEIAEITDNLLDAARAVISDAEQKGDVAAIHCTSVNQLGAGWAAHRAIDKGIPIEQAIAEAKAMQTIDPLSESRTRDYIRRHAAR